MNEGMNESMGGLMNELKNVWKGNIYMKEWWYVWLND